MKYVLGHLYPASMPTWSQCGTHISHWTRMEPIWVSTNAYGYAGMIMTDGTTTLRTMHFKSGDLARGWRTKKAISCMHLISMGHKGDEEDNKSWNSIVLVFPLISFSADIHRCILCFSVWTINLLLALLEITWNSAKWWEDIDKSTRL